MDGFGKDRFVLMYDDDNHRTMQNCFRAHPDIYGSELEEDDDDAPPQEQDAPSSSSPAPSPDSGNGSIPLAATSAAPEPQSASADPSTSRGGSSSDTERALAAKRQVESDHGVLASESEELVPKAAHDATGVDAGK